MIHDGFFFPYPLQTILNAVREYLFGETLVIRSIHSLKARKKSETAHIWLFDCMLYNKGVPSPITIIRHHQSVYITTGYVIDIFGLNYFHFDYNKGPAFDLDGKAIRLNHIIGRFPRLTPAEKAYIGCNAEPIHPKDAGAIRLDDTNFKALTFGEEDEPINWSYEVDLLKNKATHVISVSKRASVISDWKMMLAKIERIGKYGKRIWEDRRIFRHPLR